MPATGSSACEIESPEHLLMVTDSERDANTLYAVGMFLPHTPATCCVRTGNPLLDRRQVWTYKAGVESQETITNALVNNQN